MLQPYFYGQGKVLAGVRQGGVIKAMRWLLDVSALEGSFSVDQKTHKESYTGQAATAVKIVSGRAGKISMTAMQYSPENVALQERWALIFTSTTDFRIVGESVGQVGTGTVNADTAPPNPATGAPYFTIKAAGWGGGWSQGNVLRFNTAAANYPIWIARTVLQGPAQQINDSFRVQIRGDIDR